MTALAFDFREPAAASAAGASAPERRLSAIASAPRQPRPGSLDELLTSAFTAVGRGAATACPICSGTLRPRWTAGSGANGGRCDDCGSTLS